MTGYVRERAEKEIRKDYEHQLNAESVNPKYLYSTVKRLTGKETFALTADDYQSEEKIRERLDKNDTTFITDNFDRKAFEEAALEEPVNQYNLDDWTDEKVKELIDDSTKIDRFYKIHSETLSSPILIIARAMKTAEYFPKQYRTSKCTVLPKRCIFSLEAVPKILEKIFQKTWEDVLHKYYKDTYDPLQMAYEEGRGVVSCNAISLTEIEVSVVDEKEGVVQKYVDLRSAFNTVPWRTAIREAQIKLGAGKIMKTWFEGRVYTYKGEIRGVEFNRGVPAGTLWGVLAFKLFINTDVTWTAYNEKILWASAYSDDRSPLCNGPRIRDGSFQKDIDTSVEWAKEQGCEYHLTGKKAPQMLCFETKKTTSVVEMAKLLTVDSVSIDLKEIVKILGLSICTVRDSKSSKIVDKYGYHLVPNINEFKNLAYRISSIMDEVIPEIRFMAVAAQFGGKSRFSACLHIERATSDTLNKMRFYYTMAAASILGLTAYETMGGGCCSSQSVCESNEKYKEIIDLCGLQTFEDMAIIDARSTVIQVMGIRPIWFIGIPNKDEHKDLTLPEGVTDQNLIHYGR